MRTISTGIDPVTAEGTEMGRISNGAVVDRIGATFAGRCGFVPFTIGYRNRAHPSSVRVSAPKPAHDSRFQS